jgi:hypothetical protein
MTRLYHSLSRSFVGEVNDTRRPFRSSIYDLNNLDRKSMNLGEDYFTLKAKRASSDTFLVD